MRALLEGVVDYAGLFPPAALSMAETVRAYDEFRRGPHSWALGRFVVPVARLDEFMSDAAALPGRSVPWRLSVLGEASDTRAIEHFNTRHRRLARVDMLETSAATVEQVETMAQNRAGSAERPVSIYVEVPIVTDPDPLVRAVRRRGMRAKVRTGGVAADAFPTAARLARFLASCSANGVTFKATAGLHHAMRGEYRFTYDPGSATGTMFGFLNLLFASLFVRAGLGEPDATALLEERDASAFTFEAHHVMWRGHRLHAEFIRTARAQFAASFGSCSFAEPMRELGAMRLL